MNDCDICWGTGYYHGVGAPCSAGCKPPAKKHGLDAQTPLKGAAQDMIIIDEPGPTFVSGGPVPRTRNPFGLSDAAIDALNKGAVVPRKKAPVRRSEVERIAIRRYADGRLNLTHPRISGYMVTAKILPVHSKTQGPFIRLTTVNHSPISTVEIDLPVSQYRTDRAGIAKSWEVDCLRFIGHAINVAHARQLGIQPDDLTPLANDLARHAVKVAEDAGMLLSSPLVRPPGQLTVETKFPGDFVVREGMGTILSAYISAQQGSTSIYPAVKIDTVNQSPGWANHVTIARSLTRDEAAQAWIPIAMSFISNALDRTTHARLANLLDPVAKALAEQMAAVADDAGLLHQTPKPSPTYFNPTPHMPTPFGTLPDSIVDAIVQREVDDLRKPSVLQRMLGPGDIYINDQLIGRCRRLDFKDSR